MLLLVILSATISLISMPLIIKFCKQFNLYDYSNARKIHSGNIPRLGGIGVFLAYAITSLLYIFFTNDNNFSREIYFVIAGSIIFIFAIIDDIFNLHAIIKLLVQLGAVFLVTSHGFRFTQILGWLLPAPVSYILTFGWILGVINAYNLIDGLDGLCGSLSFTAITTLGIIYLLSGNNEAILCFVLAAAIFGFLCYNWPPAKLFMGDDGSQFLGFMIATFPLYTSSDVFEYNKFLMMLVITAFPVFDTIAAIWRRLRDHRPIMSADRFHLHHKLLNLGYSKTKALYLIVVMQIILCIIVIISYFLGAKKGSSVLLESLAFVTLFFSIIHFANKAAVKKMEDKESASDKFSSEKK